jgi:hypothetical protein
MPESTENQEQTAIPAKRKRGRPSAIEQPTSVVAFRMSDNQRQQMEQIAARADISLGELIRRSLAHGETDVSRLVFDVVVDKILMQKIEERHPEKFNGNDKAITCGTLRT